MSKLLLLLVALLVFSSCATLNQSEIKESKHELIEQQQLKPILDFYGERIDLLRNKTEVRGGANNEGTEDMPYHDAGFYLGNGLFYDMNGNLCLLPWYAFYDLSIDFTILKNDKSGILNSDLQFIKTDSTLSISAVNGIGFTKNYEFKVTDSLTHFTKGKLMKMEFQKKSNGNYYYKRTLSNQDIRKTKNGYYIKSFLNKDYFIQKGNKTTLANRAMIIYRDNMIEIYEQGWSKPKLRYQMLVDADNIIVYDNKFRGYKLNREGNKIIIYKNQKSYAIYEKQPY